ncbi:MAG: hypothetical protein ABI177_05330 [Edaphobacter sp.]
MAYLNLGKTRDLTLAIASVLFKNVLFHNVKFLKAWRLEAMKYFSKHFLAGAGDRELPMSLCSDKAG